MKKTITIPLLPHIDQAIELPQESELLSVITKETSIQKSALFLVALVHDQMPTTTKRIRIFGTDVDIPLNEDLEYISSIVRSNGEVWSIFECLGKK